MINKSAVLGILIIYTLVMIPVSAAENTTKVLPDFVNISDREVDSIQNKIDRAGFNWVAGETSVSRLSREEKRALSGTIIPETSPDMELYQASIPINLSLNTSFDWRNKDGKDWMTPVKSQGSCGSCWAFSAVGVAEAMINIESNNPDMDVDLSEQYLVSDCCDSGDCSGGCPNYAFEYFKDGVPIESYYPYIARSGACEPLEGWNDHKHTFNSVIRVKSTTSEMKAALQVYGPLSIVMMTPDDWYYYVGGVYEPTIEINEVGGVAHAVVLVGYNDTEGCWIVKNSYGADWGENGYGKIRYGVVEKYDFAYTVANVCNTSPDRYEPDNDAHDGTYFTVGDCPQYHTFHEPGDSDWIMFTNEPDTTYIIETTMIGSGADTKIILGYIIDGAWNFTYDDDSGIGCGSKIIYDSPRHSTCFVCVEHYDENRYGINTNYSISVEMITHLPGDVNNDAVVNIGDAVLLFNWVSFPNERETTYQLNNSANADVTGDGKINIGDAVLLFNWVSFENERGTTYILR